MAPTGGTNRMRYTARAVSMIWAVLWTTFGWASGIHEGLPPMGVFFWAVLPGLPFLLSAGIAWRWEAVGGILLVLEGLVLFVVYPMMYYSQLPSTIVALTLLTLAVPPLLAGILFLLSWRRQR